MQPQCRGIAQKAMDYPTVSKQHPICLVIVFLCINYFDCCDCCHKYLYTSGHNSVALIPLLKPLLIPKEFQQILE